ncbi:hypothetical protein V9T40_009025 [Parthenolecanium corni]|uniref:Uncharacterized protein n=1 Tax=Parthenolecanium corni TaxID=536013 RepID=A0AAN9TLX7_9HEMI
MASWYRGTDSRATSDTTASVIETAPGRRRLHFVCCVSVYGDQNGSQIPSCLCHSAGGIPVHRIAYKNLHVESFVFVPRLRNAIGDFRLCARCEFGGSKSIRRSAHTCSKSEKAIFGCPLHMELSTLTIAIVYS